jgi:LysR family carnitine catabolism transcriptional activator
MLPSILSSYHAEYPNVNISVHDVVERGVVELVRNTKCELGITFLPDNAPDMEFFPLFDDRFIALLPESHPLTQKANLRWDDILAYPHISLARPAGVRAQIDTAMARFGLSYQPSFESHQLTTIGHMVRNGLGVSVVPSISRSQMEGLGLHCKAIDSPKIVHNVGIITLRHQPLSYAAQKMVAIIKNQFNINS